MSWKNRFLGFPNGGAKAGIEGPEDLAREEKAQRLDWFANAIADLLDTRTYAIGPDMGTDSELIGELLLASKLDALADLEKSERVDLLALAAEETARAGVELTGEPLEIRGDPRMLRRLLRNLIENGLRYGGHAGIEVCVGRDEEQASVRVEDRGPGVPEAERERVFEPFYRLPGTPETGEGVGLGLALVRQIARHHGGDARCLPRPGGGTRFEVNLPLPRSPLS